MPCSYEERKYTQSKKFLKNFLKQILLITAKNFMLTKQRHKIVYLAPKKRKNTKEMMPVSIDVLRMFVDFQSIV